MTAPLLPLLAAIATSTASATTAVGPVLDLLTPHLALEYRVEHKTMRPLSLNDTTASQVGYFEQRGRVDAGLDIGSHVRLHFLADVLDGVLFGDNGTFGGRPARNRGAVIAAKTPSLAKLSVDRIDPSGSTLDIDTYGLVLVEAAPVNVREVYGEVLLPFGLLRAGRQPIATSRSVLVHDGRRINRWGVSRNIDTTDSIAFGTKLSALWSAVMDEPVDRDPNRGLFLAGLYGAVVENNPAVRDDLTQGAVTLYYQDRQSTLFGFDIDRVRAGLIYTVRVGDLFETQLHTFSGYAELEMAGFRFVLHHLQMIGETRELSESLSKLGDSSGINLQPIRAFGGFGELAYRLGPIELSFEVYWASGDEDPRSTTPITQLTFSEDTNVGLHLFENVLGYMSARSARMGVVNLNAVNPPSLPVDQIDTRGGFTNSVSLFPQLIARPFDWLSLRGGVLIAFAQVPVVDPIRTILTSDGKEITDDAVNFNGGKPASYWGTELDLGLTLSLYDHFALDLEAAYLFPGAALQDANGDAVNSFFLETRLTFYLD